MKKILILAAAFSCASTLAAAADGIREGKWSVSVTTTTTGAPVAVPQQTLADTTCITNKDPVPQKTTQGCTPPQITRNGGTISYKISCNKPNVTITSTGTVTYSGDAMSGTSTTQVNAGGHTMTSTAKITGKYLGACQS